MTQEKESPFRNSNAHEETEVRAGPGQCELDEIFTGSVCRRDKYMRV